MCACQPDFESQASCIAAPDFPVVVVYRLFFQKLCVGSAAGQLFGMIAGRQEVDEAPFNSRTAGHADSSDSPTSVDAPPEPALQSETGQQQAAAVEGQTERHVYTRQGASDTQGVPEETALKSDVGQQQAASGEGQAARHGSSSGRPQTDDAQMFASQHSMQNEGPRGQESMFAEPLTRDRQTHHDRQATDSPAASDDQPQTHHAQTFALQHQVNNEAPGSQNSMFEEPLASDSQQHQQEAVPAGQQGPADRLHTRDVQTGVPQGQAGGATQVSQHDEPQSQGSGRDALRASASQVDSSEQQEQETEQEHQSLAGNFTSRQSVHVQHAQLSIGTQFSAWLVLRAWPHGGGDRISSSCVCSARLYKSCCMQAAPVKLRSPAQLSRHRQGEKVITHYCR